MVSGISRGELVEDVLGKEIHCLTMSSERVELEQEAGAVLEVNVDVEGLGGWP